MGGDDIASAVAPDALRRMREAQRVVALTGAGISAESGIPTFRAPGSGLWSQYRIEDFATPGAWRRDARKVWGWHAHRRRLAARAQPNAGHLALARLQERYPSLVVLTQNVDGLHQRAGSRDVVELHGSLFRFVCADDGLPVAWTDPEDDDPAAFERLERGEAPEVPRCPRCGGLVRPGVVWFEEPLPADALTRASLAAMASDLFLVVGTSAEVYPAAGLPRDARRAGALVVEVNPEPTQLTRSVDVSLRGPAGTVLPRLAELLG